MLGKQLSAIIPNYNYAHFLERRINSITNQTIKPAEIIFLDDCSTDNSLEIAEQLLAKQSIPYRIIANQNNQGVFKQWLKGIELSQYDYFWIAEADDYCELNFLETLLPAFADPNIIMSYCCSVFVTGTNYDKRYDIESKNNLFSTSRWENNFIADAHEEIENYYAVANVSPNASAILFNKKLLNFSLIKGEMNSFCRAGDWMFYILALGQSPQFKVSYSSQQLNFYYRHEKSVWMYSESLKDSRLLNESLLIYLYCFEHFNISENSKHKIIDFISAWLMNYHIDSMSESLIKEINKFIHTPLLVNAIKEKYEAKVTNLEKIIIDKSKNEKYQLTSLHTSMLALARAEAELNEIKASKAWRLITILRKFRGKIIAKFKFKIL